MKVCKKCSFETNDLYNFCPKCGEKLEDINVDYVNEHSASNSQPEVKVSNFSFIVKLVVGIVALLCVPFYRIAGLECLVFAIIGSIFSLCACAWYNKLSGFIPAILFFFASCFFNGHILTQLLCIVFMALEIVAGVKIKKKLYL